MVREPDATMQPTLQDNQLMSKHRVLSFKPHLRLEWRGQDGQDETEQPDHSTSLGDSTTFFGTHRDLCRLNGWMVVDLIRSRYNRRNAPSQPEQRRRQTADGAYPRLVIKDGKV
jgi:hypothetical protein